MHDEVILNSVFKSPLRHALLREAPEQPLARPPLPLRSGHVALLLAGGLESEIEDPEQGRFLVKGKLIKADKKYKTEEKTGRNGETFEVDVYRTQYELAVTVLRYTGDVEKYTSEETHETRNASSNGTREHSVRNISSSASDTQ